MILSNDGLVAFHYRSYGTFFLHKIGSIISIGDLPTTNIIEPKILGGFQLLVENVELIRVLLISKSIEIQYLLSRARKNKVVTVISLYESA